MKKILLILIFITAYSCGQKQNQSETGSESGKNPDARQSSTSENNKTENGSKDSVKKKNRKSLIPEPVRVNFPAGSTKLEINGFVEGFAHNLTYVFEVRKGQKLTASVNPKNGTGNIRINQIINPEGKADGPFSNEMTYDLNESGDWKLIVGEDMMAGEPWKGQFVLTIEIK